MPVEIPGLAHVRAVAAGANTAYALKSGGEVWAWGDNSEAELGDSGGPPREIPARIHATSGFVAIAAGMFSAYALRRDGTVWAWGNNAVGQLGTGDTEAVHGRPRPVQRLDGMIAIAAGASDGYALRRDGTVWAWGDDSLGQLGAGGCIASPASARDGSRCPPAGVPVQVKGLSGVSAIAAGSNTGYALRGDGTVWAWGDNGFGALGGRTGRQFAAWPVPVIGMRHVVRIAAGSASGYAVVSDGSVWAWGRGVDGELGNGSFRAWSLPGRVLAVTDAVSVAGGGAMAYALDRRGQLWAWGSGFYGQLGNGYRLAFDKPTLVRFSNPLTRLGS
jgi:alpha-tubulin suppressor-like RCC1 family protein